MTMKSLLLAGWLLVAADVAAAQISLNIGPNLHAGKIGLGIDGITGSPNLLMKYFFSEQVAGELVVGGSLESREGDAPAGWTRVSGATVRGGIGLLYHFLKEQVSPYAGVQVLFQSEKSAGIYLESPDFRNSVLAALVVGGEYFMNERFSLGIKHSLGAEFVLRRGEPLENAVTRLSTETLMTGRYYFE